MTHVNFVPAPVTVSRADHRVACIGAAAAAMAIARVAAAGRV